MGIAKGFHNLGVISKGQEKYGEAIKSYSDALKIYEGLRDSSNIAEISFNFGTIFD